VSEHRKVWLQVVMGVIDVPEMVPLEIAAMDDREVFAAVVARFGEDLTERATSEILAVLDSAVGTPGVRPGITTDDASVMADTFREMHPGNAEKHRKVDDWLARIAAKHRECDELDQQRAHQREKARKATQSEKAVNASKRRTCGVNAARAVLLATPEIGGPSLTKEFNAAFKRALKTSGLDPQKVSLKVSTQSRSDYFKVAREQIGLTPAQKVNAPQIRKK
jgi:hypothetical protein